MSFNYDRTAATVTRLITHFGALATLLHRADAAYDPASGTSAPAITTGSVVAVVVDYDQKQIDGTLIRQGDRRGYLDCALVPRQGDSLTWQGTTLAIVAVRPLAPAGRAVLYEVQLRG